MNGAGMSGGDQQNDSLLFWGEAEPGRSVFYPALRHILVVVVVASELPLAQSGFGKSGTISQLGEPGGHSI